MLKYIKLLVNRNIDLSQNIKICPKEKRKIYILMYTDCIQMVYKKGNTTTTARILSVGESDRIQYHYDVALIMSLLVIPVIVGILLFRRIEREFHEIAMSLGDVGVVGDPDKKSEDK